MPGSYLGNILLVSFPGVHVPLIVLIAYVMVGSKPGRDDLPGGAKHMILHLMVTNPAEGGRRVTLDLPVAA